MWPFRRRSDGDFRREIEAHVDIEADRLTAGGMTPDEARNSARRSFGNITGAAERFYESRRVLWTAIRRFTRILFSLPYSGLGAHGAPAAGVPAMRLVHGGVERERRGASGPASDRAGVRGRARSN